MLLLMLGGIKMIDCKQLRLHIVRPALRGIDIWSPAAENLVLGTAAQESKLGEYIKQVRGPALGIFQMKPATHDDIKKWLKYMSYTEPRVLTTAGVEFFNHRWLISNLIYAAIFCRLHYRRVPSALPAEDDVDGMARYWKLHYNTRLGKGKESEFIANYRKYVK